MLAIKRAPAGDPYWNNVVFLLRGDEGPNFVERKFNKSPILTGDNSLSFVESSSAKTLFNKNTLTTSQNANAIAVYEDNENESNFARKENFTLEFWINAPDVGLLPRYFLNNADLVGQFFQGYFGIRRVTITDDPLVTRLELRADGWCSRGTSLDTNVLNFNTWHYIVVQEDSVGTSLYVDGTRVQFNTSGTQSTSNANRRSRFNLVGLFGSLDSTFIGHLAEIRWTQGVARYSGATIPVQTSPWPNL